MADVEFVYGMKTVAHYQSFGEAIPRKGELVVFQAAAVEAGMPFIYRVTDVDWDIHLRGPKVTVHLTRPATTQKKEGTQ